MNRCKTCRWWADRVRDDNLRRCSSPYILYLPDARREGVTIRDHYAGYIDAEQFGGDFRTGPEFGCVHWEAKEAQTTEE